MRIGYRAFQWGLFTAAALSCCLVSAVCRAEGTRCLDFHELFGNTTYYDSQGTRTDLQELERRFETRPFTSIMIERGNFLPSKPGSLLLTVTLPSAHVDGIFHNVLCVIDQNTYRRLSPIYYYISDHAVKTVLMNSAQQKVLVYVGKFEGYGYFDDTSEIIAFSEDAVSVTPTIGTLDPERYYMEYEAGLYSIVKAGVVPIKKSVPWDPKSQRFLLDEVK